MPVLQVGICRCYTESDHYCIDIGIDIDTGLDIDAVVDIGSGIDIDIDIGIVLGGDVDINIDSD